MKYLFYKPFWIGNPRAAIFIDEMEIAISKGKDVSLLTCSGELIDGCVYNPLKSKLTCNSCKYFRKNDLSLLSKKIKVYTIADFIDNNKEYNETAWDYTNSDEIQKIKYNGVEIGLASLSAYIQETRNQSPEVTPEFRTYMDKLLNIAALLTDVVNKAFDDIKPDEVGVFNGRINTRRPILNISQQRGIECNVFEHTGFVGEFECKKVYYKNCLPQDVSYNTKLVYETWDKSSLKEEEKIEIAKSFFDKKRIGLSVDDKSYTKNQVQNLLPEGYDETKRNITIFNSSDDEYASLGEEWEYKLSESRQTTLDAIFDHFKDKDDFHFYLRIHPNLANVKFKYVKDLEKLKRHKNLTIILPSSPISSYSLLDVSEKIITFGSTIGIEAVYNKKPAILLNTSYTIGLNVNYFPNSHKELFGMIDDRLEPKEILPVLKYAFHRIYFGTEFTYFNPNPYKTKEIYRKGRLIASFNKDYREAKYKGFMSSFINFIKYKQASVPKNLMLKINKNIIPTAD